MPPPPRTSMPHPPPPALLGDGRDGGSSVHSSGGISGRVGDVQDPWPPPSESQSSYKVWAPTSSMLGELRSILHLHSLAVLEGTPELPPLGQCRTWDLPRDVGIDSPLLMLPHVGSKLNRFVVVLHACICATSKGSD
jgi:hypothetical protein